MLSDEYLACSIEWFPNRYIIPQRGNDMMDVKEAIAAAKEYVAEVFADEGVYNIGLEEIEYKEPMWEVTIGFSRQWDKPPPSPFAAATGGQSDHQARSRTYKIVEINDVTEEVAGLRNRVGLV